ncbi:MAG: LacI family DNA-binding transcriptional regulator [Rubrivivax sp.]|nr:LacI family DNA-binding transcriptional regulator [Rubrivivax sp.]
MEPAARSRIADIARAAGVSTATVDRVLHGRLAVRPATAQRVLKAAGELRYLPDQDLWRALRPAPTELAFLLPAGTNRYLRMLGDGIAGAGDAIAPFHVHCRVHTIDSFDPVRVAAALRRHGRSAQGLAFMALEHPRVREAVDELVERGVHVLTLISDLAESRRAAYVGMDNRAAGRTAATLIGRFLGPRTGSVAMIAGSLAYRGHEEREMGFLGRMQEQFPGLRVVGVREGRDDADTNERHARALLRQHPDLVGLYNIGGGAEGVGRALKSLRRAVRPVFVAHGLTPDTRALLIDGTLDAVINQHPQTMLLNCVRIFGNLRDGRGATAGVEPVRIGIVLRENLP